MAERPKVTNSASEKELDKADDQFKKYDADIKEMTLDRMNLAPKKEVEQQTKLSQVDIEKSKQTYLKPAKSIGCGPKDKFNERFRDAWEFDKQYVQFIAENKEIIGETIDMWTRPYGGVPAEYWNVPVNKPIWGPRYLAEQIRKCTYHRLVMQEDTITGQDGRAKYYGTMAVDTTINRLEARPVSSRKSVFMGAEAF